MEVTKDMISVHNKANNVQVDVETTNTKRPCL